MLYPALDMYRLVHDVPSYPVFLNWCTNAEVLEQDHEQQLASLSIAVAGVRQKFTTLNRLVPGERLTLSLVEGPFRKLKGEWLFEPLGEAGSKISLNLAFEFSSGLLSAAFQRGFARIADHLVQEFCRRAEQIYGG